MPLSDQTYDQPEKAQTRDRVITHAVKSLSGERDSSPVVTVSEFERTLEYCTDLLSRCGRGDIRNLACKLLENWSSVQRSRVGVKKPEDLNVLLLAGPDPMPDLMAFQNLGVGLANVWAIESERTTFRQAVGAVNAQGLQLKLHKGSLRDFFA